MVRSIAVGPATIHARRPMASSPFSSGDAGWLFLRGRCLGVGCDRDFDGCTFLQAYLIAIGVLQGVVDSNFSIQVLGVFDHDLRFLGLGGRDRGNDLLHRSGESDGCPLRAHQAPPYRPELRPNQCALTIHRA